MAISRPGSPLPPRGETSPREKILQGDMGSGTEEFFGKALAEYNSSRLLRENATKMENKYKASLMENLAVFGEEDERGSRWWKFNPPVNSYDGRKVYTSIKRERRVSRSLDTDRAEIWLRANKLYDSCVTLEPVFDEDLMLALNFNDMIPDDVLDSFYDENVTWAFKREDEDV